MWRQIFDGHLDIKTRIGKSSREVVLYCCVVSLVVVLEKVDPIVLTRQVLQRIPLTVFKVFETLVLSIFFPQQLLSWIFDFILKLELIFLSHLHLHSLGFFVFFAFELLLNLILPVLLVFTLRLLLHHTFILWLLHRLLDLEPLDGAKDVFVLMRSFWL